jgi:hypothetical protein
MPSPSPSVSAEDLDHAATSMIMSPQDKQREEPEIQPVGQEEGDPRMLAENALDTEPYNTETPFRGTPPHNFTSEAEQALTETPPTPPELEQEAADANLVGGEPLPEGAPKPTGDTIPGDFVGNLAVEQPPPAGTPLKMSLADMLEEQAGVQREEPGPREEYSLPPPAPPDLDDGDDDDEDDEEEAKPKRKTTVKRGRHK